MRNPFSILFSSVLFLSLPFSFLAQKEYTLQECIDFGIQNTHNLISQKSNTERAKINQQFGKWSFLPSLSASPNYNISFGRKLDPFTNTFGTNKIYSNMYGLNSQMTLFQAGRYFKQNNYFKQALENAQLDRERSLEKTKLQIFEKCVSIWKIEVKLEQQTKIIENLKIFKNRQIELVKEGRLSAIDTLETSINSKLQTLTYLKLKKEVNFEYLNLNYLIGLPLLNETRLERFNTSIFNLEMKLDEQYQLEDLKSKLELVKLQYEIDKTQLLPSLALTGNLGTGYSTNNKDYNLEGAPVIPFSQQFNHNAYQGIGFYLNVPIFNKADGFKLKKLYEISQSEQALLIEFKGLEIEKRKLEIASQKQNLEESLIIHKGILKDKETIYKMNQLIYLEGKIRLSEVEKVEVEFYSHLNTIQDLELELIKISFVDIR